LEFLLSGNPRPIDYLMYTFTNNLELLVSGNPNPISNRHTNSYIGNFF